jgi:hypothetical protein
MTKNEIESIEQNQLIADIAHDIIIKSVPKEKYFFSAIKNEYFKDPEKTLKGETGKGEKLDFGVGVAVLMSPIILAVVTEVVKFIAEEVKKDFKEESSSFIHDIVKKMFKKSGPAGDEEKNVQNLTSEQLKQVHRVAIEKARQLNLPEKEAGLLADSVVSGLVITA